MVRVSVIIPLYNKSRYITKCIDSVLAQTHTNFELIVVDDGSTDDSAAIVCGIRDDRLRLVSQPNKGVSAARNRGLQETQYDLVAFLDADDWWDPDYLTEMASLIKAYPDVLIYSAPFAHVENGAIFPSDACVTEGPPHRVFDALDECVRRGRFILPFSSSSVVLRKDAFIQAGLFDPAIAFCEDYDLFVRVCIRSRCAVTTGRPLVFYNKDVPADQRATGRLFPLERSLVGHLDKFEPLMASHSSLRDYIELFRVSNLLPYVEAGFPATVIVPLLRSADSSRFTWKHRIYFSFTPLSRLFVRLNVFQRAIRARCRRIAAAR